MPSKREWVYPVVGILVTYIALSAVSLTVYHNRYSPSTKQFRLY